jgi:hypothetical protein
MAKETPAKQEGKHIVTKPFRDKDDFSKEYAEGDDVSHFDANRLEHLKSIGHVEEK